MRVLWLPILTLLLTVSPAAALLIDQESSNDSMSTALIQINPSGVLTTAAFSSRVRR